MGAFRVLLLLTFALAGVQGQIHNTAAPHPIISFWELSEDMQILNLADYFAGNDLLLRKGLRVLKSLQWIWEEEEQYPVLKRLLPHLLDTMPDLFSSAWFRNTFLGGVEKLQRRYEDLEIQDSRLDSSGQASSNETAERILQTSIDETDHSWWVSRVQHKLQEVFLPNQSAEVYNVSHECLPFPSPAFDNFTDFYNATNLTSVGLLHLVFAGLSEMRARDILNESLVDENLVDPGCFHNVMDFLDIALVLAGNDTAVPSSAVGWVWTMLDSFGKPSGGIVPDMTPFAGSPLKCLSAKPSFSPSLPGEFHSGPRLYTQAFGTRFCRVTFTLPDVIARYFDKDMFGKSLTLRWGTCLPDTCHSQDVAAIFSHVLSGKLSMLGLAVDTVDCGDIELDKLTSHILMDILRDDRP